MKKTVTALLSVVFVLGFVAAPASAAGKGTMNAPGQQKNAGCEQRARAAFMEHWSPRAAQQAQNERRCVQQQEFLALFTGGSSTDGQTTTGVLRVSAPEGTTVVKTFQASVDGELVTVNLECGPTGADGLAECPITFEGLIVAGLPVTNVFTLADGSTVVTKGTSFCSDPTIPVGETCFTGD